MKHSGSILFASAALSLVCSAQAAVYNEGDVTLRTSAFEKCDAFHYPYWGFFWGAFPPARTPFTTLRFDLMTRTSTNPTYEIYVKTVPPAFNGRDIRPNMCATLMANGHWYRIQIFAQGNAGEQEVSWVSVELRTTNGASQCF